jgi:hypothetical protein
VNWSSRGMRSGMTPSYPIARDTRCPLYDIYFRMVDKVTFKNGWQIRIRQFRNKFLHFVPLTLDHEPILFCNFRPKLHTISWLRGSMNTHFGQNIHHIIRTKFHRNIIMTIRDKFLPFNVTKKLQKA